MKRIVSLLSMALMCLVVMAQWSESGQTISTSSNEIMLNSNNVNSSTTIWLNNKSAGPTTAVGHYYIKAFDWWGAYLHFVGTGDQDNERMTVTFDGNVGIGTDAPTSKLHVSSLTNGDAIVKIEADTDNSNESDNPLLLLQQDGGAVKGKIGLTGNAGDDYTESLTNNLFLENTNSDFGIQFVTQGKAQLTILPSGNVAIGKPTADHKLDVAGTIRAEEILVEAKDNTADFVFEPDYHLRNLSEVETFIKENKHLPEIPSAAQMEEQGVNLAEMNKLLLQKVEELTLYAICQKAEVNKMKEDWKQKAEEQNMEKEKIEKLEKELEVIKEMLTQVTQIP